MHGTLLLTRAILDLYFLNPAGSGFGGFVEVNPAGAAFTSLLLWIRAVVGDHYIIRLYVII